MTRLDTTLDGVWRDRGELRGEQPIELLGLEQAGNGFRHRTPLLAQADTTPALVDTEALHSRKLAILAGQTFDAAPLPRAEAAPEVVSRPLRPIAVEPPASQSKVIVVLGVFAALMLWAWRSVRSR